MYVYLCVCVYGTQACRRERVWKRNKAFVSSQQGSRCIATMLLSRDGGCMWYPLTHTLYTTTSSTVSQLFMTRPVALVGSIGDVEMIIIGKKKKGTALIWWFNPLTGQLTGKQVFVCMLLCMHVCIYAYMRV